MGGRRYTALVLSCVTVLCLDLITKETIIAHYSLYESRPVIPGFFNLVHYRNKGVAFGLFGGAVSPWREVALFLFPLAAVIGIFVFTFSGRKKGVGVLCALGGILGGALGNLLDRIRYGGVVDFLDFYWGSFHWPAFNLADTAITIGVFYLVFYYGRNGGV